MSKKLIFSMVILAVSYVLIYGLTKMYQTNVREKSIQEEALPVFITAQCEDEDTAIGMLQNNNPLCLNSSSLYMVENLKKRVIEKVESGVTYLPSTLNYIIKLHKQQLFVMYLPQQGELINVGTFSPSSDERFVSLFFYTNAAEQVEILVTLQKEAKTKNDDKSIFVKMTPTDDHKTISVTTRKTRDMLKIIDIKNNGNNLYLQEMFPFLEKKYRVFDWQKNLLEQVPCEKYGFLLVTDDKKVPTANSCKQSPNTFLEDSKGTLLLKDMTLYWQSPIASATPMSVYSGIRTEGLELLARYRTRNGKRVYNCFDFTESLQITLRTCILEL